MQQVSGAIIVLAGAILGASATIANVLSRINGRSRDEGMWAALAAAILIVYGLTVVTRSLVMQAKSRPHSDRFKTLPPQ